MPTWMQTEDLALKQGLSHTRSALEKWWADPRPVLLAWGAAAAAIGVLMLVGVTLIATAVEPDVGFGYIPTAPGDPSFDRIAHIVGKNSLVLALHAFACVAGFIAGSSLPLSAERKSGISRWIHDRARPVAFAWVTFVTLFSLATQTAALGIFGSTLADSVGVSPLVLVLTAAPHALLELTAVFLPLAAWVLASRRDDWDELLAATFFTVGVAIPMLLLSAAWEIHVWPRLVALASPVA